MHAHRIIQGFLKVNCQTMHAKRRACLAKTVEAASVGGLSLTGLGRASPKNTSLKHRVKSCDRLLGNEHLQSEKTMVYRALSHAVLGPRRCAIIIDWSDLLPDGSAHLLRAAVMVKGRAFVLYEEVHPQKHFASLRVHRHFLEVLRTMLPPGCHPTLVTDAGFRATWFKLASSLNYEWAGRIRNRDMVRAHETVEWKGCKAWYPYANARPRDLGKFEYVRSNPTPCRLIAFKKAPRHRHCRTASGAKSRSTSSLKNRAAQIEPWLIAVSPGLAALNAKAIAALYGGRMQIEQTFRDSKNPKLGMGLSNSQTRNLQRLATLLLIGALLAYALWLIGLAAKHTGYSVGYGGKKSANTFSILSLARLWCTEVKTARSPAQIRNALDTLRLLVTKI